MQLSTHTHTVTDQFFRAITLTHTDCRVILQMIFFSTCIKNGRQCTKYRHIWPKSRTQTLIIHNILFTLLHFCLPFTLSFLLSLFVCWFCVCVSVIVLLSLRSTLVCFSYTLTNSAELCCMICCLFVFTLFSFARFDYYWNN